MQNNCICEWINLEWVSSECVLLSDLWALVFSWTWQCWSSPSTACYATPPSWSQTPADSTTSSENAGVILGLSCSLIFTGNLLLYLDGNIQPHGPDMTHCCWSVQHVEMTTNHHKNSCRLAVFIIFCICYSRNMTDLLLNAQKICSENMYFLNVCF